MTPTHKSYTLQVGVHCRSQQSSGLQSYAASHESDRLKRVVHFHRYVSLYKIALAVTNLSIHAGTRITVLGSYADPPPTSEYTIDNGAPTQFTPSLATNQEIYDQVFYTSPELDDGEHTISLTLIAGD